jgi:hypothetical protein
MGAGAIRDEGHSSADFRILDSLAWGHYLYVDDLSPLPDARRHGQGRALSIAPTPIASTSTRAWSSRPTISPATPSRAVT